MRKRTGTTEPRSPLSFPVKHNSISNSPSGADGAETLVVLHGIAAHSWWMAWLSRQIARPASRVLNWSYPSLSRGIPEHAAELAAVLRQLPTDATAGRVHLVTHSMGCIVARGALNLYQPPNLGRWVMLTPPNRGSHIASGPLGRWLSPWIPAVGQLADTRGSYVQELAVPEGIEFGIVAARWDWLLRRETTPLPGQRDYLLVDSLHSGVIFQRRVARAVRNFLDYGQFEGPVPA